LMLLNCVLIIYMEVIIEKDEKPELKVPESMSMIKYNYKSPLMFYLPMDLSKLPTLTLLTENIC
jgi:hypothetical protein